MLLFKLLILAHFIADFPLQSARIYRLKKMYLAGQLPHALIYLIVMVVVGYPLVGDAAYWLFIALLACTHLGIDIFKIQVLDRGGRGGGVGMFLLDQGLHLSAISLVFLTSLPGSSVIRGSILADLDAQGVLSASIAFIIVTFAGVYLLDSIRITFSRSATEGTVNGFAKFYGMAERGAIFLLILGGGIFLALIPLVLILRLPAANYCGKRFRPQAFLMSLSNLAGNVLLSSLCALVAAWCIPG
ncbi:MAG: DUF3307 domain-containing protein [Candidatus Aureabacteria bacterium]|nr:DUF3307 domain-containing protein [Candidatus Auribacterota bacterium]